MRALRHFAVALLACATGCASEAAAPAPLPDVASVALEEVGEGAVEGEIDGEPFVTVDARFRVVDQPGRERVELLFSDRAIERCGLPMEREERLVWLRFGGRTHLDPGSYAALEVDTRDFSLHWERPVGEGLDRTIRWGERGVARVEITSASPRRVQGRVSVCFAGEEPACVAGRFDAAPCWSRIDGRTAREPPGLVDEALVPRPREPRAPRRTYP